LLSNVNSVEQFTVVEQAFVIQTEQLGTK